MNLYNFVYVRPTGGSGCVKLCSPLTQALAGLSQHERPQGWMVLDFAELWATLGILDLSVFAGLRLVRSLSCKVGTLECSRE